MSEPFLAEIRIVGFNFAPRGWAFCDGQLLPINQNQSLYSLLGTTYGGDGRTSFALPELRGRTPIHVGNSHLQGQRGGEEVHTLTTNEIPTHNHSLRIKNEEGGSTLADGNSLTNSKFETRYTSVAGNEQMNTASISNAGAVQAHDNMQPTLVLNFCIALQGLFPSRN
jgi:microcystin-dependent protein